mmetsp:Transcript_21432/g.29777  ORF Transcript_21432/g.29777 Transcript_21432/m.29777 type:complete len:176 (-) Transcript_21432:111-638(-)|eukprot:CAMPEP_0196585374 /NCGR_PEP_ID=MMETSP1081-20130531/50407_1 /TAXON_ID=36882 /ORGANISM="Pyramimonas amylifera, Strain CCMP720" /LENGTH=175 /DNA_ID=CAMNT_0041906895 /DNA_START=44 /DNA_END=571 /DNA_ORIENTATION=+
MYSCTNILGLVNPVKQINNYRVPALTLSRKPKCAITRCGGPDDEDEKKPPPAKRPAASKGPGMAPMSMETIEQRNAAKAFRKGGASDDFGGGGGGGDDGDDGGWFNNDDGEANPVGVIILGVTAVAYYFYQKGEKARKEEEMEAAREALEMEREAKRQKQLVLRAKRGPPRTPTA